MTNEEVAEVDELVGRLRDDLHIIQRDGLAATLATVREARGLAIVSKEKS